MFIVILANIFSTATFFGSRNFKRFLRSVIVVIGLGLSQASVAKVSISGIQGAALENVEIMLSLTAETCDSPAWKIERLFEQSQSEIDRALRAFGYYHSSSQKSLSFDDECWRAVFDIDAGIQTTLSSINLRINGEGENDPELQSIISKITLKKGDPLLHDRYEKYKQRIKALAMERGYLKGRYSEKKLRINTNQNSAEIKLVFDSGSRFRFGKVIVDQKILSEDFLRKLINIEEGAYYSPEYLVKAYRSLSSSGYFESIDIKPDIEKAVDNKVPIVLTLSSKKKHGFGFGVGFDTDIGPLFSASHSIRRLNRSGHSLKSNIKLSPVLSSVDTEYIIPLDDPVNERFSIGAGYQLVNSDSVESGTATLSAQVLTVLQDGWRRALFLDWSHERFATDNEENQSALLVPGGSWRRSVSDNLLRPTKAYSLMFEVKGSYENPISDVSFVQTETRNLWITSVPWGGKFVARIDLGATLVSKFEDLPTSYRFFAGGINSIRGYDYQELGPVDADGDVIGGRFLTVASAEYEHPIFDNWGLAVFVDGGNAFNENRISIKSGVGFGLRWYSPIGPVRIDIGFPLDEAESSVRFHFAAGTRL